MNKLLLFGSHVFHLCPDVAEPDVTSFVLADNFPVEPRDKVADIGTGSGFLAVLAASKAERVVATDVSIPATRCARANSVLNTYEGKIEVRHGHLLDPLEDDKFTLIVANLPQMPTPPPLMRSDWIGLADSGGEDGRVLIDRFIDQVRDFLVTGGRVCIGQFGFLGIERTLSRFRAQQFEAAVYFQTSIPVGRLTWERLGYMESIGLPIELEERLGRLYHKLFIIIATRTR